MKPTDSFTWFAVNFGISVIWLLGAILSHNYFLAIGALVYAAVMMLIELPDSSSEEGTGEEPKPERYAPDSFLEGPLHSEEELGGGKQGEWRGSGPPPAR